MRGTDDIPNLIAECKTVAENSLYNAQAHYALADSQEARAVALDRSVRSGWDLWTSYIDWFAVLAGSIFCCRRILRYGSCRPRR